MMVVEKKHWQRYAEKLFWLAKDKKLMSGAMEIKQDHLHIDDCIEATRRLMQSDFSSPINIGSEEMVSIKKLAEEIIDISNENISINHILNAPVGVRGRNSNNDLIRSLRMGLHLFSQKRFRKYI